MTNPPRPTTPRAWAKRPTRSAKGQGPRIADNQAATRIGSPTRATVALVATAQPASSPAMAKLRAPPRCAAATAAQRVAVTKVAVQVSVTKKWVSCTGIVASA